MIPFKIALVVLKVVLVATVGIVLAVICTPILIMLAFVVVPVVLMLIAGKMVLGVVF